jgi:2-dehydro-3-deoxyphosphogluconate aldolase / (4S)-4-hydroxy-2-oxoglutarate aldolase
MNKQTVRNRIEEVGIIPGVRVSTAADAEFAAEAIYAGGIPIVEITMTVPNALQVITHLVRHLPDMIVGAGSVLDTQTARACLDAGAGFLTSTGFDPDVVDLAVKQKVVCFPGALTPTEVVTAWKAGADYVKIFPCSQVGGESYIKALKAPLPQVPMIAAGGVNQMTAANFILAGASAIGVGTELVPRDAIRLRRKDQVLELVHRFVRIVKNARSQTSNESVPTFR